MVKKPLVFSIDNRQNESENEMLCRLKVYRKQARRIKNAISGWPLVPDNTRHYGPVAWTSSLVTNKSKLSNYIWSRMHFVGIIFTWQNQCEQCFLNTSGTFSIVHAMVHKCKAVARNLYPSFPSLFSFPSPSLLSLFALSPASKTPLKSC